MKIQLTGVLIMWKDWVDDRWSLPRSQWMWIIPKRRRYCCCDELGIVRWSARWSDVMAICEHDHCCLLLSPKLGFVNACTTKRTDHLRTILHLEKQLPESTWSITDESIAKLAPDNHCSIKALGSQPSQNSHQTFLLRRWKHCKVAWRQLWRVHQQQQMLHAD